MSEHQTIAAPVRAPSPSVYNRILLLVAGFGGLLYGIDVGIIASALPYLEATSQLSRAQLSLVVAAVLLGSVISTLFAGALADLIGRKPLMALSGVLFIVSIPLIALSSSYSALIVGRLLQGVSGGLIGVVVPLYLAECLKASDRGMGTGMFQWLLTLGIVTAALIGVYFSARVDAVAKLGQPEVLFAFKDHAWRAIFWVSLPPGILFVVGSLFVSESPRWLFRRGRVQDASLALLRSRTRDQAELELREMHESAAAQATSGAQPAHRPRARESLWRRKYVIPFLLACVILACNQTTGVNSIIGYSTTILIQSGLSDMQAHWGYVVLTSVNFAVTLIGVALVDRKGRKFLLSLGSGGIVASLLVVGMTFRAAEDQSIEVRDAVQTLVKEDQTLSLRFDNEAVKSLLESTGERPDRPVSLTIIFSYGAFRASTPTVRSDDATTQPITITRADSVPANGIIAFFSNPLANLGEARSAPLHIDHALVTPVPSARTGGLIALCLFLFMAFFAVGPGVCVWLALSELMPTRIRSNGMSIALLINQAVSTTIAALFLPAVGRFGYSNIFFGFAVCTVIYFLTVTFLLPETKGRTLEEIESIFASKERPV